MDTLSTYLPQDRRHALARGEALPSHAQGAVLFADVSGFTPLTETLTQTLGPRHGAEELTLQLDAVYSALIAEVERYGGSVIGFAGDAITCWFDASSGPKGLENPSGLAPGRAVACALALQKAMTQFASIPLPNSTTTTLALKVAVASGPARRFVVGDPEIQQIDTLAGATIARTATAEALRAANQHMLNPVISQVYDETVASVRLALGEEAFNAAWAEGQAMTMEEAIALALSEPEA